MSVTNVSSANAQGEKSKAAHPPPIDLLTCQPDELASWLNNHRFQNNAMEAASFLLTCTSSLPNAEEISAQLMGNDTPNNEEKKEEESNGGDDNNEDTCTSAENNNLGEVSTTISSHEVSCINPRGRFAMSLHSNGIKLKNPKKDEEELIITKESVENVVWFRKPEDYKSLKQVKEGSEKPIPGHMVLICLGGDHDIIFRKKVIQQICLQLPQYPAPSMETDEDISAKGWENGLKSSLLSENAVLTRVLSTVDAPSSNLKGYTFKAGVGGPGNTSTTTAGMPFVGCNRGFNNGALYPLREGLLFFKPPLFVPRSNLASISCGRGSGQSRFVDMVVQLDDDDDSTLEFTNIEREELQGLNEYIHNVLIPAMKKDAAQGSGDNQDESSDEDEEVAMAEVVDSSADDSESDDIAANTKRKSSRAASKSARESTRAHFAALNGQDDDDDDDDDSDVESFSGGEGGHSSDESDEGSDTEMSGSVELSEESEEEEEVEEESDESDDDDSFEDGRSSKKAKIQ